MGQTSFRTIFSRLTVAGMFERSIRADFQEVGDNKPSSKLDIFNSRVHLTHAAEEAVLTEDHWMLQTGGEAMTQVSSTIISSVVKIHKI